MSYIAIAGAVVSAGTAAYGASQQSKAGKAAASGQAAASKAQLRFMQMQASERERALKKLMSEGAFEFPSVDAGAAANESLGTTTRNMPGVLANTATAYDSAAANFERYLQSTFGKGADGKSALDSQKSATNQAVMDQLMGRLSQGTRTLLGRRALASGATNLGRGAVQDAYTYQLGLAAEDQVRQGVSNYGQLYEQYGRFAPQISPMDMLNYGGLSTNSALQNSQFNASGQFQAQIAQAEAILGNIDRETQFVGSAIGGAAQAPYMQAAAGAAGAGAMGMAVGQGLSGIMGTYYGARQTQNSMAQTGMRYADGYGYVPVYGEGARLNQSMLPSAYYRGDSLTTFSGGMETRRALPVESQGPAFGSSRPATTSQLLSQQRGLYKPY